MRFSRTAVAGIAATAAFMSGGIAYAATSSTPTASTTDTIVTIPAGKSIGAAGGAWTTIATLSLPPGRFVIHASGDLVNFGPSDFTRCQIVVAGAHVDGVSTLVGDPGAPGEVGAAGLLSPFALVGGAVNATTATVPAALQCEHDSTNGANPYVDGDASFWAHATSSLQLGTE